MRLHPYILLFSGALVASSACSDAVTTSPLAAPQSAGFSQSKDAAIDDVKSYTFSVDPTRSNHLQFGAHSLNLPANAICVADSGYGAEWWDVPCATATGKMTVTVVVTGARKELPRIDLQPAIRFSPRTRVVLEVQVQKVKDPLSYSVLYCATSTSACVDESLVDPTLAAIYDRPSHTLYRRIKHFSGYLVAERE